MAMITSDQSHVKRLWQARKPNQWIKCWSFKDENVSSIPQTHTISIKLSIVRHACSPSGGKAGSLGLPSQLI